MEENRYKAMGGNRNWKVRWRSVFLSEKRNLSNRNRGGVKGEKSTKPNDGTGGDKPKVMHCVSENSVLLRL